MEKIQLKKEMETLLIPLMGKIIESRKNNPILVDEKALEIIDKIDYDFETLKIPNKTNIQMSIRARLIDNYVLDLNHDQEYVVLHLGCGFDCRFFRLGQSNVDWYDVDFEEVINIRKKLISEQKYYHMIGSSVTDQQWLNEIPVVDKEYIVIAEGLFMYLEAKEIQQLIDRLINTIGRFTLIFDAFSKYTAKKVKHHRSLKKTGAIVKWGLNDPEVLEEWNQKIVFIKAIYFTDNRLINQLNIINRIIYKIAGSFSIVKKAHRILVYKII